MLNVELSDKSMNTEYAATTILFSGQKKIIKEEEHSNEFIFQVMQHFTPYSHMIPIERFSARLGTTSHQGFRVKLYDRKKYEATSRNSTIKN